MANNDNEFLDFLVVCPCCGSDACYQSEFTTQDGKITSWICMTCGYTSNTTMVADSKVIKDLEKNTAQLIIDNKQIHNVDGVDLIWYPTVITMPEKGMIYPEPLKEFHQFVDVETEDGNIAKTVRKDWSWVVVKAIPVKEEEKEKYPIPNQKGEFYKTRMDMKNSKRFGKLEFMDAAEELGMFKGMKKM
jgi:hypothetical protein